ncbi:MAG: hypothetical protein IPO08_22875 [Xanthomonadales bacterium]|nr:hypothetical protein [Xanthomonadales bacterium]
MIHGTCGACTHWTGFGELSTVAVARCLLDRGLTVGYWSCLLFQARQPSATLTSNSLQETHMVTGLNGFELVKGQTVRVHQEEGTRVAQVVDVFPDRPTVNEPGHWVDIDSGDGAEGMPSYILEVIAQP